MGGDEEELKPYSLYVDYFPGVRTEAAASWRLMETLSAEVEKGQVCNPWSQRLFTQLLQVGDPFKESTK